MYVGATRTRVSHSIFMGVFSCLWNSPDSVAHRYSKASSENNKFSTEILIKVVTQLLLITEIKTGVGNAIRDILIG